MCVVCNCVRTPICEYRRRRTTYRGSCWRKRFGTTTHGALANMCVLFDCTTLRTSARPRDSGDRGSGLLHARVGMANRKYSHARTHKHTKGPQAGHQAYVLITYMSASHNERVLSWSTSHTRMHRFPGYHAYVRIVTHMAKADADLAAGVPSCQCSLAHPLAQHTCVHAHTGSWGRTDTEADTPARVFSDDDDVYHYSGERLKQSQISEVTHTGHYPALSISDARVCRPSSTVRVYSTPNSA